MGGGPTHSKNTAERQSISLTMGVQFPQYAVILLKGG